MQEQIMASTRYLRRALGIDLAEVQEKTRLTREKLDLIESGQRDVPAILSDYYANKLQLNNELVGFLLSERGRRVPGFEACRKFALNLLNGYLRFSLWMTAFNEDPKNIPS